MLSAGKTDPVAETAAPAAGQILDTELQSENGSSASANNNILPRDPNEVLAAINAVGVALPLSNDFKKEFNTFAEKNNFETHPNEPSSTVTLENGGKYQYYPYMDTFIYYDENE